MASERARDNGRIPEAAYQEAVTLLMGSARVVLTTHRNPDGDGLGAEVALAEALGQLNREVRVINDAPVPPQYRFLGSTRTFETYRSVVHRSALAAADCIILLDAARPDRTGRIATALSSHAEKTLSIDHHQVRGWARRELIDPFACATVELVHELLLRLPVTVTPDIAEALYAGLVADTLCFRTASVSGATHRRAAALFAAGADHARVHEALFAAWPLGRLRLQAHFLANLHTAASGRLVWGVVERHDLTRWRQGSAAVEGLVDEALTIRGAELALLFLEEPEHVRLSCRSRHGVRADELAREFGGGGHVTAAGARLAGTPQAVMRLVVRRARALLARSS